MISEELLKKGFNGTIRESKEPGKKMTIKLDIPLKIDSKFLLLETDLV